MGDPEIDYAANETRQLTAALVGGQGVVGGHDLKVVQRGAGANMSVDVNSGHAVVTGDDTAGQGSYVIYNDTDGFNVTVPAAPGSGTRLHRVVAQIRDKRANGAWSTYDWTPLLLADTGGGTPAEPASALTLATVSVAAGQASVTNANINDLRVFIDSLGFSDTWHNLSLLNGWANRGPGYMRAAYRIRYLGSGVQDVDIIGEIVSGTTTDNTAVFNLPAGYQANVHQHIWATALGRAANNDPPYLFVSSTGDCHIFNCSGANTIIFSGTIHLDAPGG